MCTGSKAYAEQRLVLVNIDLSQTRSKCFCCAAKIVEKLVHKITYDCLSGNVSLQIELQKQQKAICLDWQVALQSSCWCVFETITLAYNTVKPIAIGRLTQVFRNGMTSAPLPGAVTTNTSCEEMKNVNVDPISGFLPSIQMPMESCIGKNSTASQAST